MPRSASGGFDGAAHLVERVGSSIVVRSPGSRPSHRAWIERRSSLPERVFGSAVTKWHARRPRHRAELAVDRLHHVALERQPGLAGGNALASLTTAKAMATWPFS